MSPVSSSTLEEEISSLFLSILLICSEEGLIGKHMFAIDGCKLSSNASKEWSGTRADFMKKREKIEKSITFIINKHKEQDKGNEYSTDIIVFEKTILTADSGNHSEENMKELFKRAIEAYIADNRFRKRDPDFASADRHKKKPTNRTKTTRGKKYFQPSDFTYDAENNKLICPAGCELYIENSTFKSTNGLEGIVYRGKKTDCRVCKCKSQKDMLRNLGNQVFIKVTITSP